jgi:mRNA-degrading endonuclease RelE of RelBE toxin-antitoxin system
MADKQSQFELEIAKKLNKHLDDQEKLQDETKDWFQEWFAKNLNPIALANEPDKYLDEMGEKAMAAFRVKFLPEVEKIGSEFGKSIYEKAVKK